MTLSLSEAQPIVKLDRLHTFFSTSPAAKLLRSPHAASIVYFLYRQFKESANITLAHSQLLQLLNEFLEETHHTDPDILKDRAEIYITSWSTGDSRWLRRFLDSDHTEAVYELTPHTESVLKFLDDVLDRNLGFVGTESRLKRIIDTLSDIVVRGSSDPGRRLNYLRAERQRIDCEILSIEAGAEVTTYSPTAVRERFADTVTDLASLQSDFRAVEESFKEITRNVQKQQSDREGSRGEILGTALEAEDCLKSQDQGVSFDEFVRLVFSPSKQDELECIVSQLDQIDALIGQAEGMRRLRGMIGSLSIEAEKVLRTTRRLSATLRRLLDTHVTAGRLRLANVLFDIRATAVRLADEPPGDDVGIEILNELDLQCASERTFWTQPAHFDAIPLTAHQPDEDERHEAFRHFAELRRLDWSGMRSKIASLLQVHDRVALTDLLDTYPLEHGATEVLGYLQIAHDDGHSIDPTNKDLLLVPAGDDFRTDEEYEAPRVTFLNSRLRSLANGLSSGDVSR